MLQGVHQGAAVRQQSKLVHVCDSFMKHQIILSHPPLPLLPLTLSFTFFPSFPISLPTPLPVQVCSVYVWFRWGRESDHFAVCPWVSPEVYQLLAEGKLMSITRHTMWFKQHLYGRDCLVLRPSWVLTFCTWYAPIPCITSTFLFQWVWEHDYMVFYLATAGSQNMSNLPCWSSSIAVETVHNLHQTYHL